MAAGLARLGSVDEPTADGRRDHLFDDSRFRRRFPDLEEPPLDRLLAATAASFA